MKEEAPKLFVSYSWSTRAHEDWVLGLATELCENGVDVVLDKWHLKEGQDAHAFMEQMVTDSRIGKVVIICDRLYVEKADGRSGGVGTETQIMTPEIYSAQDQTKFVAVLPERDDNGKPYLPVYYKSRIYIDLSTPELYGANFEQLLRWIFDKPLYVKPKLGNPPAFLADDAPISLQTTSLCRRALKAIRENDTQCSIAIRDYFQAFSANLEQFRIQKDGKEFDEKVIQSIEMFLPYRNEVIEVFSALAKYRSDKESWEAMHHFLESILPYAFRPKEVTQWQQWDFDNFKFIVHELFLYAVAILTHYHRFDGVVNLIQQYYYLSENFREGHNPMVPFSVFREPLESLQRFNDRLNLRLISHHATLLEKRSKTSHVPFQHLMQADLLLYIRDCLDCLKTGRKQNWWPVTLMFARRQYGPFEVFARAQSAGFFDRFKEVFHIDSKEDLLPLRKAYSEEKLVLPQWVHQAIDPFTLTGFDELATLP